MGNALTGLLLNSSVWCLRGLLKGWSQLELLAWAPTWGLTFYHPGDWLWRRKIWGTGLPGDQSRSCKTCVDLASGEMVSLLPWFTSCKGGAETSLDSRVSDSPQFQIQRNEWPARGGKEDGRYKGSVKGMVSIWFLFLLTWSVFSLKICLICFVSSLCLLCPEISLHYDETCFSP